jgi:hypothetical protein
MSTLKEDAKSSQAPTTFVKPYAVRRQERLEK